MIQEALYSLLAADAGVSALSTKVFQVAAPPDLTVYQGGGCISFALVGGSSAGTLKTSGVIRQRMELNAWADKYKAAATLRATLIKAVNGWQAVLSDGTNILNSELLNPGTDFVTEDRIFRCMCEFYIHYTLPTS